VNRQGTHQRAGKTVHDVHCLRGCSAQTTKAYHRAVEVTGRLQQFSDPHEEVRDAGLAGVETVLRPTPSPR
jgi:hypothetical protein